MLVLVQMCGQSKVSGSIYKSYMAQLIYVDINLLR